MSVLPPEIKEQLEEWSDKAETDGAILEEQLRSVYDALKKKAPQVPEEELWAVAKDKLYSDEIRDILKSKAEMYIHMFIGASALRDRNSFRRTEAERLKNEDFDKAVEDGWINEDGKPLSQNGRLLRAWWTRQYLAFSIKAEELADDPENPEFNFFLGQLQGRQAQLFGKKPPKRGIDPRLRPRVGQWYRTRWTHVKDDYPVEVKSEDGEVISVRSLGRSAKVTNFATREENVDQKGLEAIIQIAESFPEDLIIPIEKDKLDQWAAEHIIVDTDDEGKDVRDWNAFGLIIGRLMQINMGETFASIILKSADSNEEIRITFDPFTLQQIMEGVGTGSTIAAFALPFLRKERDESGKETGEFWEATGMGAAVLRKIPILDLDEEEEEEDEDIIEDDDEIEEID